MGSNGRFSGADADDTRESKIAKIKANAKTAQVLEQEIKDLIKPCPVTDHFAVYEAPVLVSEKPLKNYEKDAECEELYHKISTLNIASLEAEEVEALLSEILPSDNLRYKILLDKIILMLYGDIVQYNRMFLACAEPLEREEITKESQMTKLKMDVLSGMKKVKEIIDEAHPNNNIFFLQQELGNVLALTSVSKIIPQDYHARIANLILPVKDGVFMRIKSLVAPFFEIRVGDIRVFMDKLSDGNYIILDVFLKKDYSSLGYKSYLNNLSNLYLRQRSFYLTSMSDPGFVSKHNEIFGDMMDLLQGKAIKAGGRNG
ncbi:MAG: hypothetical protein K2J20_00315 [Bacilli bacterium]|nr:hypothetical protein [Bacilli bacterium]